MYHLKRSLFKSEIAKKTVILTLYCTNKKRKFNKDSEEARDRIVIMQVTTYIFFNDINDAI